MILLLFLFLFQIPIGILNHKLFRRVFPYRPRISNRNRIVSHCAVYLGAAALGSFVSICMISSMYSFRISIAINFVANYIGWGLSAVGLTGGIGSGKSTASKFLHNGLNIEIVDADAIARCLVKRGSSCYSTILKRFGPEILDPVSQEIDRQALGRMIFSDRAKKAELERITHPRILLEMLRQLVSARVRGKEVVLDVPLLLEKRSFPLLYLLCNECICIDASEQNQKTRLLARNPEHSVGEIEARISSQLKREDRLQLADYIINNDGQIEHLFQQLRQYFIDKE